MKSNDYLDEILMMIRTFKDDPVKLKKLHQYIGETLYEEEVQEIIIPEKYRDLVKNAADYLGADMICYINVETLEHEYIPAVLYRETSFDPADELEETDDHPFYGILKSIGREWGNTIKIEPPESRISFTYMEQFVESLGDCRLKTILSDALSGRKPFSRFNNIIHQSPEREEWFAFRQKCLEGFVVEALTGNLPGL